MIFNYFSYFKRNQSILFICFSKLRIQISSNRNKVIMRVRLIYQHRVIPLEFLEVQLFLSSYFKLEHFTA